MAAGNKSEVGGVDRLGSMKTRNIGNTSERNRAMSRIVTTIMVAVIFAAGVWMLAGCEKKQTPPPAPPKPTAAMTATTEADKAATTAEASKTAAVSEATEQTTCPVMGGAIDKKIFVEYKGKKVYFCCSMCPAEFQKNPEKYISKLPQFKNP
jgi:YHS domain-containing protein